MSDPEAVGQAEQQENKADALALLGFDETDDGESLSATTRSTTTCSGRETLTRGDREAVARWMAIPEALRPDDLRTNQDLARLLGTNRVQIWRLRQRQDVIARARYLVEQNKAVAQVTIRAEWPDIVAKQVERARAGDLEAAKWLGELGWDLGQKPAGAQAAAFVNVTVGEAARATQQDDAADPTWIDGEAVESGEPDGHAA